jgi:ribA/ribD-fused uncharacterized protein
MSKAFTPINLITNFDDFDGENEFRFLSNFYIGEPLLVFSDQFMTGEHAFQAMKCCDTKAGFEDYKKVKAAKTPGQSKTLGRKVKLRPDWEEVKYDAMAAIIRSKFSEHRDEGIWLLETGDALLVEGTAWHDTVWGTTHSGEMPKARGRNWLGTLLMARRAELRATLQGAPDYLTGRWNDRFAMITSQVVDPEPKPARKKKTKIADLTGPL